MKRFLCTTALLVAGASPVVAHAGVSVSVGEDGVPRG